MAIRLLVRATLGQKFCCGLNYKAKTETLGHVFVGFVMFALRVVMK